MAFHCRAVQICHHTWRRNLSGIAKQSVSSSRSAPDMQHLLPLLSNTALTKSLLFPSCHIHLDSSRKATKSETVDNSLKGLALHGNFCRQKLIGYDIKSRMASWTKTEHLQYVCPSEKLFSLPQLVMVEEAPLSVSYDLPKIPSLTPSAIDPVRESGQAEILDPTNPCTGAPRKAREIQKIRRKKMNRHRLKKFRKRMLFTFRKMRLERRKKKEAKFQAKLDGIREWGNSFSALEWAQEELNKARKGGYYINILSKKS